jgi:hypothetical protein
MRWARLVAFMDKIMTVYRMSMVGQREGHNYEGKTCVDNIKIDLKNIESSLCGPVFRVPAC